MNCQICNRPLNNPKDPLSLDCGGDCWGCIGQIEADSRYKPSIEAVLQEKEIREKDKLSYLYSCNLKNIK